MTTSEYDAKSSVLKFHFNLKTNHSNHSSTVEISPDGRYIATSSSDKTIKLFKLSDGSFIRSLNGHSKGISSVSWSPDSRHIASASDDKTIKIWDIEYGECIKTLRGHTYHVTCVQFNFKGNLLISGSADEAIRIWDVLNGKCLKILSAHSEPIESIDLCWDGTIIASGSYDGLIRLFDTETGQCVKTLIYDKGGSSFPVSYVKFSPNGRYLLATTLDNTIRLWDYNNNRVVKTFQGASFEKYTCSSRFIPSLKTPLIVSGSESGEVFVWNLNSKSITDVIKVSDSPVLHVDIIGNILVSLSMDGDINVFKVKELNEGEMDIDQ
ncbi:hypothetical protein WICMUC_000046 [Wickerhamomyces mucosus]|uniref:WDR5-like beta-propeller domain-containing protein n=1 Tax=Wickerhamomyces mucosus TaxID=1378264 RepID=A0A9P8PYX6_9ASCO|nr:hypothetical protein WICMUC_000046 [Wickerhamomyces mucosus]